MTSVGVHVGAGAGACLVDVDGEVGIMLTLGDFVRCGDDGIGELLIELAEFEVGLGTGGLKVAERMENSRR